MTGETDSDLVIDFNPRPPWGGRRYRRKISCLNCHFNPRPPWGGRPAQGGRKFKSCKFQSTPSVGRATRPNLFRLQYRRNFNPRPPWGGRPEASMCPVSRLKISIHALRGEGDERIGGKRLLVGGHFNPRPPWGGRRKTKNSQNDYLIFQSTPSVGRATPLFRCRREKLAISIHALRGEGDVRESQSLFASAKFQSTPSVGRATASASGQWRRLLNFNPRPPWGGRPSGFLTALHCS